MNIDKRLLKGIDWFLLLITTALVAIGIIFITNATASPFNGNENGFYEMMSKVNMYYPILQLAWFSLGLLVIGFMCFIDYHVYGDLIKIVYVGIVVLLFSLLVMGIASRGTAGWFKFGDRAFQPSEPCKVVLVVLLAKYASKSTEASGSINSFWDYARMCIYVGIPLVLVAIQPDLGTAFVYVCIFLGIIFAARVKWRYLIGSGTAIGATVVLGFFTIMRTYQKNRILSFLGMEGEGEGLSFNVEQALLAIGSGGKEGKGVLTPGSSVQLGYLPEAHTDFIFASGVEAWGFVGGVALIALYFLLLIRILYVGAMAKDDFGKFICVGVVCMFIAHIFENIAMNMNVMPVTGIPLPFVSYGGSSMLTNMVALGLVININMRRPQKRSQGKVKSTLMRF